jgi:hypothetical protein
MSVYTFAVEGTGAFPYDMLRWDRCFPKTQASAQAMSCPRCGGKLRGKRKVELIKPVERISDSPTVARWESFGWTVVEETFVR